MKGSDKTTFTCLDTTQSDEEMAQVAENIEDEVCIEMSMEYGDRLSYLLLFSTLQLKCLEILCIH